jgi:hypothetical protein
MIAYLLFQLRSSDGGIVLFHDINRFTVAHLEAVILALRGAGFTFTNIDDEETFPRLNEVPESPVRSPVKIGAPCEADTDCDYGRQAYLGFCHPDGFCSSPCEDRCRGRNTRCVEDRTVSEDFNVCVVR